MVKGKEKVSTHPIYLDSCYVMPFMQTVHTLSTVCQRLVEHIIYVFCQTQAVNSKGSDYHVLHQIPSADSVDQDQLEEAV